MLCICWPCIPKIFKVCSSVICNCVNLETMAIAVAATGMAMATESEAT